jgi:hypothetical protein
MKIIALSTALFLFSIALSAEPLMLRVEVEKQEYTGYHPACNVKSEDSICIPFHFWHLHKAKVLDVIIGDYKHEYITYAMLHHAEYTKEYVSDVYVVIKKFKNKEIAEQLGVDMFVEKFNSTEKIVCIPTDFIDSLSDQSKFDSPIYEQSGKSCYQEYILESE